MSTVPNDSCKLARFNDKSAAARACGVPPRRKANAWLPTFGNPPSLPSQAVVPADGANGP